MELLPSMVYSISETSPFAFFSSAKKLPHPISIHKSPRSAYSSIGRRLGKCDKGLFCSFSAPEFPSRHLFAMHRYILFVLLPAIPEVVLHASFAPPPATAAAGLPEPLSTNTRVFQSLATPSATFASAHPTSFDSQPPSSTSIPHTSSMPLSILGGKESPAHPAVLLILKKNSKSSCSASCTSFQCGCSILG